MNYNIATLSNGLRIIHQHCTAPVVYCGYLIAAGSRNEAVGEEGLAHFCEHMTFKGTTHRRAWNIINGLDSVGGDLNASTRKDCTTYDAAILRQHLGRAVDLLTDMVFCSTYPQTEIDKEAAVICDEIDMYKDSTADLIYDEFENIIFHGNTLGHNILGTPERVRAFTTADAQRFTRRHYTPSNAVFYASGDVDFKKLVRLLERTFRKYDIAKRPLAADGMSVDAGGGQPSAVADEPLTLENMDGTRVPISPNQREIEVDWGCHQSNVIVGCRSYDVHDPRRVALLLLSNMLGGPRQNSRLNMVLREHRGLVYSVGGYEVAYDDCGMWYTYFACDQKDVRRCLRLVRRELDSQMQTPISMARLRAAKKQIVGQIGLDNDDRGEYAWQMAKAFLLYGKQLDMEAMCRKIEAVQASDIQKVARDLFAPERMTTLIYK